MKYSLQDVKNKIEIPINFLNLLYSSIISMQQGPFRLYCLMSFACVTTTTIMKENIHPLPQNPPGPAAGRPHLSGPRQPLIWILYLYFVYYAWDHRIWTPAQQNLHSSMQLSLLFVPSYWFIVSHRMSITIYLFVIGGQLGCFWYFRYCE